MSVQNKLYVRSVYVRFVPISTLSLSLRVELVLKEMDNSTESDDWFRTMNS